MSLPEITFLHKRIGKFLNHIGFKTQTNLRYLGGLGVLNIHWQLKGRRAKLCIIFSLTINPTIIILDFATNYKFCFGYML